MHTSQQFQFNLCLHKIIGILLYCYHGTFHGLFNVLGRILTNQVKQYSTNTDYMRQNETVRQINDPLLAVSIKVLAD